MALDYLFIIDKPYDIAEATQQIRAFATANGKSYVCIESIADPTQIAGRLAAVHRHNPMNRDTTVLVLGQHSPEEGQEVDAHGVAGGGQFAAEALLRALHGLVVGRTPSGEEVHWSGTTYFNDSRPDVIQALEGAMGSEGPVLLRESDVRDTRSLNFEFDWLRSLDAIQSLSVGVKRAAQLLSASKYFSENITILQQGLSPLLLKTPTTYPQSIGLDLSTGAAVAAFVNAENARLANTRPDTNARRFAELKLRVLAGGVELLKGVGMTELKRRVRALQALKLGIARGGPEAFRVFVESMPETAVTTYLNANVGGDVKTVLGHAVATGNSALVLEVLGAGAISSTAGGNISPLTLAASQGEADVVNLLIRHARSALVLETLIDTAWQGNTALMSAAMGGHLAVAGALLDAGASPVIVNQREETALMSAAVSNPEIVKMFLNRSPTAWGTIDAVNYDGETALLLAARTGQMRSVESLLEHGANHLSRTSYGATALMAAAYGSGDASTLQLLVQEPYRNALDIQDENGATALWHAAEMGRGERAKILFLNGANAAIPDEDDYTPLLIAAKNGHQDVVTALLSSADEVNMLIPIDVNWTNRYGSAALHEAAAAGHAGIVGALVAHGANVNLRTRNGDTPLMVAARNGKESVIARLLQERAAVLDVANAQGQTALDLAIDSDHYSDGVIARCSLPRTSTSRASCSSTAPGCRPSASCPRPACPSCCSRGSGIDAVYFGEAMIDPADGQHYADAQTLALWKSSLLDKLMALQDELDTLTEQRAHNAPYELRTLDGEAAPAWAQLVGGAVQIIAPEWNGNLPLEVRGNRQGEHASQLLNIESRRFDGQLQLGTNGADHLVHSAGVASLLAGGRGDDRYGIDAAAGDLVFENADEGYDTSTASTAPAWRTTSSGSCSAAGAPASAPAKATRWTTSSSPPARKAATCCTAWPATTA